MTGMLLAAPESCQKWNSNSLILDIWIELSSQNGGVVALGDGRRQREVAIAMTGSLVLLLLLLAARCYNCRREL